jgi:hypothetical protein
MPPRALGFLLTVLVGLATLASCAHYRLGTGGQPGFSSLYVTPVHDTAGVPQAAAAVTAQIREAFLRDGRVALAASPSEADAVLTIALAKYARETLTAQPRDTGLARKFGLTLDATATLTDRRTGRVLFENRPLRADRQIFTDSGQTLAEYDAFPLLAEQLAQAAAHAVLDTW